MSIPSHATMEQSAPFHPLGHSKHKSSCAHFPGMQFPHLTGCSQRSPVYPRGQLQVTSFIYFK